MPNAPKKSLRSAYARARSVDPRPISGKERPEELLAHAFPAYVGRQERTAFELMRRSLSEDASVFLTLSGAMTPAGLHQSCLIPLVERGVLSVLTTTGANLYHDAHRVLGHAIREVNPGRGRLENAARPHHPHLRLGLLGGGAPGHRPPLLGPHPRPGVSKEDDDPRVSLPPRKGHAAD